MKHIHTFENFLNENSIQDWPTWFSELDLLGSGHIPYFFLGINKKGEVVKSRDSMYPFDYKDEKDIIDYLVNTEKVDRKTIFSHNNHWTRTDQLKKKLYDWGKEHNLEN